MSRFEVTLADPTLCADVLAMCACELPKGHSENHGCSCGGSWDADGEPVTFPQLKPEQEARFLADMFLIASQLDLSPASPVPPEPKP